MRTINHGSSVFPVQLHLDRIYSMKVDNMLPRKELFGLFSDSLSGSLGTPSNETAESSVAKQENRKQKYYTKVIFLRSMIEPEWVLSAFPSRWISTILAEDTPELSAPHLGQPSNS